MIFTFSVINVKVEEKNLSAYEMALESVIEQLEGLDVIRNLPVYVEI